MRWVDFMLALPGPLVAIVVVGVVGGGYWTAVLVLIILFTAPDTRIVRSAVLEQRPLPYIDAARTLGVSKTRILFVHILPNVLPIILAYVVLDFAFALVNLAGLSFLGLGVEPGTPDWGRMLFENRTILFTNPVALLLPGGDDHPDRGQHEPDRRLAVRAADPVSCRAGAVRGSRCSPSATSPSPPAEGAGAPSPPAPTSRSRAARAIAIVGESGSGKSLTAKAIARLLPPGVFGDRRDPLRRPRSDGARRSARCGRSAAGASRCCCRTRSRC